MNFFWTSIYLLTFLAIGKIYQHTKYYSINSSEYLSHLIIYFTSPILTLYTFIWRADKESLIEMSHIALAAIVITNIMLLVTIISAKVVSDKNIAGVFVLSSTYSNTLFFGLPIIIAFFGEEALVPLIVYSTSHFACHIVFGTIAATYYSSKHMNYRMILREIIKFPPFLATLFGLLLLYFEIQPDIFVLRDSFRYIGHLTSPLALILLGMNLKLQITHKFEFFLTLIYKFVVIILITIAITQAFALEPLSKKVIFFESLMPPAIFNFIISKRYGLDKDFAASIIFSLTLISFPIIFALGMLVV